MKSRLAVRLGNPYRTLLAAINRLGLELDDGHHFLFDTYQVDDQWELRLDQREEPIAEQGMSGIYRHIDQLDLPTGVVENVQIWFDEIGDLADVQLTISGDDVLFTAGEVYEGLHSRWLDIGWMDESVFVFRQPKEARQVVRVRSTSRTALSW